jgi:lipoprotein NlpD
VESFSSASQGRKGIAISGRLNSPVVAAASGRVVYRGSGLTGYGNLLIIKHSERWLSAYAHNDKMMVKEGDAVKAGQQVATMGASGTFRTQLHFEIRKDGKPVDPMGYLPKR